MPIQARNSNIEAMPMVAMLSIVAHHYSIHGGVLGNSSSPTTAAVLGSYLSLGKWGVEAFVLIGSDYMAQS